MLKLLLVALMVACTGAGCVIENQGDPVDIAHYSSDLSYYRLLQVSQEFMDTRKFALAKTMLEKAASLEPQAPEPLFFIGQCLFRMDRYEEAIRVFEQALVRDPLFDRARFRRWAAMLEDGQHTHEIKERIAQDILALLALRGQDPGALHAAFLGYGYIGYSTEKRDVLSRFLEVGQHSRWRGVVVGALVEALLKEPDVTQQWEWALQSMRLFPDPNGARQVVRVLTRILVERSADIDAFHVAAGQLLQQVPENSYLYEALARVLIDERLHTSTAILWLERVMALEGFSAPGSVSQSRKSGTEAMKVTLRHSRILLQLGLAHLMQERVTRAQSFFEEAVEVFPGQGKVWHYLALIAVNEGRTHAAALLFQKALETGRALPDTEMLFSAVLNMTLGTNDPPNRVIAGREGVVTFSDVTDAAGLRGVTSQRVAWGDYDQDGFEDLLLDGPRIYRNAGTGQFMDLTAETGLALIKGSRGGLWGDYNHDGFLDLFLFQGRSNRLLRNNRGETFTDVTSDALPGFTGGPTEAAAWGDLNNDGWPDLYVANYERAGVELGLCGRDYLLLNRRQGDGFTDVSLMAGIRQDEAMCGRGVVWADLDQDGWQDILVSNYRLDPNVLWSNQGDGTVRDVAQHVGLQGHNVSGAYGHSIASVVGDLDHDDDVDVFTSNLAHSWALGFSDLSMVLLNGGQPDFFFQNHFAESGMPFEETNADAAFGDVDNDGDLDLFVTSIYPGRSSHLYLNDGEGHFRDVSWISGTQVHNAWGTAFADYDRDGDLDLFVASQDGVRLFRNDGTDAHWLIVQARSERCDRFGIGTRVTIRYDGTSQVRIVTAGKGTGTQNALAVHFGLGSWTGPVEIEASDLCNGSDSHIVNTPDRFVSLSTS